MLVDGRQLNGQIIETSLCIIGAGAAGIAIANQFLGTGISVTILESGGREYDSAIQALCNGENDGQHYDLFHSRLRYLGGSTNHWTGMCAPLDSSDFGQRPWIQYSGWPFGLEELQPFYDSASRFLDINGTDKTDFGLSHSDLPDIDQEKLLFRQWLFPKNLRLGETYRERLAASENIRILLHASATTITAQDDHTRVTEIEAATLENQHFTVKANYYVLAAGGIENARLLLLSNRQAPAGLGNGNGLVGRFFMEHPILGTGKLFAFGKPQNLLPLVHERAAVENFDAHIVNITPSTKSMQKYEMLNGCIFLTPFYAARKPVAVPDYIRRLLSPHAPLYVSDLFVHVEQAPNPDSRITLSANQRDALGLPVAKLHWALTDKEAHTARMLCMLASESLSSTGLGVTQLPPWADEDQTPPNYDWSCHHMGTTRMSDDPRQGVVDRNCKLHGIDNLYIAGSSVYPTVGWANPTYTLIALALRLSEKLKALLY